MPLKRSCETPYCSREAAVGGYCRECRREAVRPTRQQLGYDAAWYRFRARYLREHPLCEPCRARGRLTLATEPHHKKPLREYPELKYDEANLVACCRACHTRIEKAKRAE
jgi:5-methylcytosine-specific restriction enzyme A